MGRLPDGLTLEAQLVNGEWVAANNRTLYVAQQANLSQVHPVDNGNRTFNVIRRHFNTNGVGGPIRPCP